MDLERAFSDLAELIAVPEVDIVAVTVKVPHHFEIVKAAINAGKHVYCEWPLGNGHAEAEELDRRAQAKCSLGVVGTQARVAPEIVQLCRLIEGGLVGQVLSTMLVAPGGGWGGSIPEKRTGAYLLDRAIGATLLTIPLGHTLAALTDVMGGIDSLSSVLAARQPKAVALDTGETFPCSRGLGRRLRGLGSRACASSSCGSCLGRLCCKTDAGDSPRESSGIDGRDAQTCRT